jgi:hypothetical protein
MNMVGIHVVRRVQRGNTLAQPLDRQAIGGIDAGGTQNADHHPTAPEGAQLAFGVNPATGAGRGWPQGMRLVNQIAVAIAVHTGGADVHDSLW